NVDLAYNGYRARFPFFNISMEKDYGNEVTFTEVVTQDFSRVLLNIINNACYALHQKKEASGAGFEAMLKISTRSLNDQTEIRIWDNGPGIPAHIHQQIFDPFFTTKPSGSGNTGLGLSISYEIIVQGHRGELSVNSEEGVFTEFVIRLPVSR
ncbi:MAG: two-component sensor histidine kinase, partial [Sinomicrobium sp.]|nr:two-component sensor histidine kinase [Sinomicrobium sp.]